MITYRAFVNTRPGPRGITFTVTVQARGVGLWARSSARHMVWTRDSKGQPVGPLGSCALTSVLFTRSHCDSRVVCDRHRMAPNACRIHALALSQDGCPPLGSSAVSSPAGVNNVGKPAAQQARRAPWSLHLWPMICF